MAEQIQSYLREQMPTWKDRYTGVEEMKVAVMGCVVNGPGESKHASLGISLPGTFEEPKAPVYVDGRLFTTLKGDHIVAEFIKIMDEYVESHYAAKEESATIEPTLGDVPGLFARPCFAVANTSVAFWADRERRGEYEPPAAVSFPDGTQSGSWNTAAPPKSAQAARSSHSSHVR